MTGRRGWRRVVADVLRTATPAGRRDVGCFCVEGTRLLERALRAGAPVEDVVATERFRRDPTRRIRRLLGELDAAGIPVHVAPDRSLEEVTEGRGGGAVVGLVRSVEPPTLGTLLDPAAGAPAVLLAAVDVEDPGNAGALVRTALAAGARAFVGVGVTDAFHPRAVRISRGSVLKLPILRFPSTRSLIEELSILGLPTWGAVCSDGIPLHEAPLAAPVALLVGNEARGLGGDVRAALDGRVTIPMAAGVDSLSVNAAAALVLYEVRRRRSG